MSQKRAVGLIRAFYYAGAREIVAGLWKINDKATVDLMVDFHKQLKNYVPSEALRNAQLNVLNNGSIGHPFYWSAFGVYGME